MMNAEQWFGQAPGGGGGYQIERSIRLNSADSAHLSRTPASAGNRKTWTWAGWVKPSATSDHALLSAGTTGAWCIFRYDGNNLNFLDSGAANFQLRTTAVFRDYSAWYHVVLSVDTTQASAANRMKIYVNGVEASLQTASYPTQNLDIAVNNTVAHAIGQEAARSISYFSGYLADIHFIDGQALTPSSFTEVSATTGQLIPKAYTGTFGTNGFWLKFSDNSAATATTLGKDYSGNSNNWTPNNLSVTAGAGNDSLVDTPTSYGTDDSLGGSVRGNYATLNPLANGSAITLSNGNLDGSVSTGTGSNDVVFGTVGISSGKWYWEVTANTGSGGTYRAIGIGKTALNPDNGVSTGTYVYYGSGEKAIDGSSSSYGASYANGDVIGVAFDADAGTLTFYKNGTTQGTAATGLTAGPYVALVGKAEGALTWAWSCNFGQRAWAYTPPANHRPVVDTLLPSPVVAKSSDYFQTVLYTGNGSTQTISGLGFSPDLVWIKSRSNSYNHYLVDTVRGFNGANARVLQANLTDAESSGSGIGEAFTAFTSDGFTVKDPGGWWGTNQSSATYVGWAFDAGTTTTTNTAGSITSTVRANPSAGFSVCTYTGSSSNFTFGHGLNVEPRLILIKNRSASANWFVITKATGSWQYGFLNATDALAPAGQSANSTTVDLANAAYNWFNANGDNFVAYCFAPVAGYSSLGSYVGNGSTDGPFVYTGHRSRWIMIKNTTDAGNYPWFIVDTARSTYNISTNYLQANTSDQENFYGGTSLVFSNYDMLSNGFKIRDSGTLYNKNGSTYIYCSFAESPFQYARAR